jgi:hypothetical protein
VLGPAGLIKVGERPAGTGTTPISLRVVDGGYFENFGALTLIDIVITLRQMIEQEVDGRRLVPIFVQVTSDPSFKPERMDRRDGIADETVTPIGVLAQTRAPIKTLLATRNGHGLRAVAALKELADAMGAGYFHLGMGRTPGRSDPPLAWVLSEGARATIDAFASEPTNKEQLDRLRLCLQGRDETKCGARRRDDATGS